VAAAPTEIVGIQSAVREQAGMSTETFSDDFVITARWVADGVVLVAIAGDLDFETAPKAMAFLTEATATGPEHLILDLAGVAFMASSGLALLITARSGEEGIQGNLHLLGVIGNRAVERPLAGMALLDLFDIGTNLGVLLSDLDAVQSSID
jgi:anti-sigma B factor antagonist